MREYIDKADLISSIEIFQMRKFNDYKRANVPQVMNIVKKYPAADAAEVVRCKDCKFCDRLQSPEHGDTLHFCRRTIDKALVDRFDYCSKGRKRDGEENA